MSDVNQPGEPTEEEIRAYLQQVREADPAAIVVQAYRMLGEGAELKLGRADARVLIDALAAVAEATAVSLPAELVEQMRDGVRQLQSAQVQAEREQGEPAATAAPPPAAAQPAAAGAPGSAPMTGTPRTSEPTDPKVTDRLWIPGRGPRA
jgi:hypothetical protein